MEWISVNDRLPEDDKSLRFHVDGVISFTTVMVYTQHGLYAIANRLKHDPIGSPYLDEYATNGWIWSRGCGEVTHWMPLPEPPKEDA